MEQITLYYRQGSSDKVYQASIAPKGNGYVVLFAYGRRGTTLQTGTKTTTPVPIEEAKRIYDKLIAEKQAKGYTPGEHGTPYQQTGKAHQVSRILPQLLNPIESAEATGLLSDPGWCLQEKYDGKRMLLCKTQDGIDGVNRKGLVVALPEAVASSAAGLPGSFIIDGECVGDTLVVFDLLELNGADQRSLPYRSRLIALIQLLPDPGQSICCAATAFDAAFKAGLLQRLRAEQKEGAVFKRLDAPYIAGRPASGGDALKCKFYETAAFIVCHLNAQRSVAIGVWNGKDFVAVGNVTIPPSQRIPAVGAIVEIRYLYAFRRGAVYQPVYLGERDDIDPTECVIDQLKFKEQEAA
jgi:bifunctional non-homologous end joining protein LigD